MQKEREKEAVSDTDKIERRESEISLGNVL